MADCEQSESHSVAQFGLIEIRSQIVLNQLLGRPDTRCTFSVLAALNNECHGAHLVSSEPIQHPSAQCVHLGATGLGEPSGKPAFACGDAAHTLQQHGPCSVAKDYLHKPLFEVFQGRVFAFCNDNTPAAGGLQ